VSVDFFPYLIGEWSLEEDQVPLESPTTVGYRALLVDSSCYIIRHLALF